MYHYALTFTKSPNVGISTFESSVNHFKELFPATRFVGCYELSGGAHYHFHCVVVAHQRVNYRSFHAAKGDMGLHVADCYDVERWLDYVGKSSYLVCFRLHLDYKAALQDLADQY